MDESSQASEASQEWMHLYVLPFGHAVVIALVDATGYVGTPEEMIKAGENRP